MLSLDTKLLSVQCISDELSSASDSLFPRQSCGLTLIILFLITLQKLDRDFLRLIITTNTSIVS